MAKKSALTQNYDRNIYSLRRDKQYLCCGELENGISKKFSFAVESNSLHHGEQHLCHGEPVNGLSISFMFVATNNRFAMAKSSPWQTTSSPWQTRDFSFNLV